MDSDSTVQSERSSALSCSSSQTKKCNCSNCSNGLSGEGHICDYPGCHKVFQYIRYLYKHKLMHRGKIIACPWKTCKRRFKRSDEMKRHYHTHTGLKPYECSFCNRKFSRSDHLRRHIRIHLKRQDDLIPTEPEILYTCDSKACGLSFTNADDLKSHSCVHNSVGHQFDPLNLNALESMSHWVSQNIKSISDLEQEMDNSCLSQSDNETNLVVHIISDSEEIVHEPCDLDTKGYGEHDFSDSSSSQNSNRLQRAPNSLICPWKACNTRFKHRGQMNRHYLTHTGEKNLACSVCNKKFYRNDHLKKHLKIHFATKVEVNRKLSPSTGKRKDDPQNSNSEFPIRKSCSNDSTVSTPIRDNNTIEASDHSIDKQEKKFVCSWKSCDKMFRRREDLKRHYFIHTGEKRYECSICEKKFSRHDHLKKHVNTHLKDKTSSSVSSFYSSNGPKHQQNKTRRIEKPLNLEALDMDMSHLNCEITQPEIQSIDLTFDDIEEEMENSKLQEILERPIQTDNNSYNYTIDISDDSRHSQTVTNIGKTENEKDLTIYQIIELAEQPQPSNNSYSDGNPCEPIIVQGQHICGFAYCQKMFNCPTQLANHLRVHTIPHPYVCDRQGCENRRFKDLKMFQNHQRIHNALELRYTVNLNSKNDQYRITENTEHQSDELRCGWLGCNKSFKNLNGLRRHHGVHVDEKKFVCTICEKAFRRRDNLNQHRRNVHFKYP